MTEVMKGSPAWSMGVERGDVLLSINGDEDYIKDSKIFDNDSLSIEIEGSSGRRAIILVVVL